MKPCSIITIGNFDGVHVGHTHIINHLAKFASSYAYRKEFFAENKELAPQYHLDLQINPASCLLTFTPHPASVLGNKFYIPLMTHEKRLQTLKSFPLHNVETLPFTKEFSRKSSAEFCEFLVKEYNVAMLFIGHDFKIGQAKKNSPSTGKNMVLLSMPMSRFALKAAKLSAPPKSAKPF